MIPAERQLFIRKSLEMHGMVSITNMSEQLQVSPMTIRRDIQLLADQGHAILISGGARSTERITTELSQAKKRHLHYAEKSAIAQKAITFIPRNATIFLDAGTTGLAIAEALAVDSALCDTISVVTNDITVATHLMTHAQCRLFHTGGEVVRSNKSCVGEIAAQMIRQLNFDIAFLSTSSWSMDWISTPDPQKIFVKRAAMERSQQSILVSDSTKYGKIGFFNILQIRELSGIITDTALPLQAQKDLVNMSINLMLVSPEDT